MTHAEAVTKLMNESSYGDPVVLDAWLHGTIGETQHLSLDDALRIALLQIEGTRNAVHYLAKQMDILDPTVR